MAQPVWITGAGGLIGGYVARSAPPGTPVRALTREHLNLTDAAAVSAAFRADRPAAVIHCAALSKSVACQENPPLARRLNVDVTAVLAGLAAAVPFLLLSTDMVFDGRTGNYDETAAVHPLSAYAETKVAAEEIVLANPRHFVVRTSLNGGVSPTGDRGFNEEMANAWRAGRTLSLFTDEFRCPLPAAVTARALWELLAAGAPGLYHLAGSRRLSRWEIGRIVAARRPELNARREPGSLRDYQGAPRSPDTSLNCAKIQRCLSFPLPGLEEWLTAHPTEPF